MTETHSQSRTTTDHDEIRRWAEERGGRPAKVRGTGGDGDPGILRIKFDDSDEDLEEISWDEFFDAFDRNRLPLVYDPDPGSRFQKFVSREG
jgi:hypothetical protein